MNILTDKQYKNYDRLSRYEIFPTYYNTVDNKYFYGTTAQLSTDTPFISHKVSQNDTWDSLALYYYGNPTYYWIICDFNRIQDPLSRPKLNTIIKIPTFSAIKFDI